jgi:hypothetical protein
MRLGQLSRKLGISTSEIIGFLASKNVAIGEDSNTKIEDDHTNWVIQKYAPELLEIQTVIIPVEKPQPVEVVETPTPKAAEPVNIPTITSEQPITDNEQPSIDQLPEVIKAPKIELSGLKVLGKIEIPEKKKKEIVEGIENQSAETENKPSLDRRPLPIRREFDNRPRKNPVTLQREKEEREMEMKRKEEILRAKERKAYHYQSKVKSQAAPKRIKMVEEPLEETITPEEKAPTTVWGKFKKWLRT